MSQNTNSLHALYVARLIVGVLTGIVMLFFSSSSTQPNSEKPREGETVMDLFASV